MLRKKVMGACCASLLAAFCTTFVLVGAAADTRIADAAMRNDLETVRSLIRQAVDVNSSQGDGMSALHWAALNGQAEMAQVLVYAGANVRATTRLGGYTPLFMAAKAGASPVVGILLKAGADARTPAMGGITPLMMAASSGSSEALKMLLDAGADVNAEETERGQTALVFAASFNQPEAIRTLVQNGADVNRKSNPLKPAVRPNQRPPQAQQQGQRGQQPQQQGQQAQQGQQQGQQAQQGQQQGQQAQQGQQTQQAQQAQGQRGQQQGQQPQQQGQQNQQQGGRGNLPPDPASAGGNPRGELTALMYAARQGNMESVRALVDGGARLNEVSADHSTALLLALINGSFDIAKLLIERGADVTIASVDGATPLHAVVNTQWAPKTDEPQPTTKYEKTHYFDLMKLILDRGADPNTRLKKELWYTQNREGGTAAGTTPFWKCAGVGDIDCMRLLVSHGADPNVSNIEGITPLLVASGSGFHGNNELTTPSGRLAAVKYLIEELHADVNSADTAPASPRNETMNTSRATGGFTALHNAAARGDNAMILYLVSKGARVDVVSRNGTTVVDMANGPRQRIQPYADTVALLEMLGAKNSYKCISC